MNLEPAEGGDELERFRSYLRLLARVQLGAGLRTKVDPSDLVQQTLVRAWQSLDQLRGQRDVEVAAWLRQILARTLANAVRDLAREKRDVGREVSLEGCSGCIAAWVYAQEEETV